MTKEAFTQLPPSHAFHLFRRGIQAYTQGDVATAAMAWEGASALFAQLISEGHTHFKKIPPEE